MSKNPKAPKDDTASLSFEAAMEQVEAIIDKIEHGEVGLEQSIAEYERGVRLIRHCRQIHQQAVQRVDDLTQRLMSEGAEPVAPPAESPASPDADAEP